VLAGCKRPSLRAQEYANALRESGNHAPFSCMHSAHRLLCGLHRSTRSLAVKLVTGCDLQPFKLISSSQTGGKVREHRRTSGYNPRCEQARHAVHQPLYMRRWRVLVSQRVESWGLPSVGFEDARAVRRQGAVRTGWEVKQLYTGCVPYARMAPWHSRRPFNRSCPTRSLWHPSSTRCPGAEGMVGETARVPYAQLWVGLARCAQATDRAGLGVQFTGEVQRAARLVLRTGLASA
jgi:hypothetical protein